MRHQFEFSGGFSGPFQARSERRRSRRFPCQGTAEAMVLGPEMLFRGELSDISLKGCFLRTRSSLNLTRFAKIDLRFFVDDRHYRTRARVMDIRPGTGLGIEFFIENAQTEDALKRLIGQLHDSVVAVA